VEAVFYFDDESRSHAASVRAAFTAHFGLALDDVPLLEMKGWMEHWYGQGGDHEWFRLDRRAPFRLADGG